MTPHPLTSPRKHFFCLWGALLLGTLWLTISPSARATGLLITKDASREVRVHGLRALLHFGQDQLALHLQLTAKSNDTDVAWIIPVPLGDAKKLSVLISGFDLMKSLEKLTAPLIEINNSGNRAGCGRGSVAKNVLPPNAPTSLSQLFESERLDIRPIDVSYSGDDKVPPFDQLAAWLQKEGFTLSTQQEQQLKDLASQGAVQFVYAHLRFDPNVQTARTLEPLVIRLPRPTSNEWTLPLSLSPHTEDFPAVFFTIGTERYGFGGTGWLEQSLADTSKAVRQQYDTTGLASYEQALINETQRLAKESQQQLVVPEFKQDLRLLCPKDQTEDDANYTFCQDFIEVTSLSEDGFSNLTRLRVRPQLQTALPEITFVLNKGEDITGRVLALQTSTTPTTSLAASLTHPALQRRNSARRPSVRLLESTQQADLFWLLGCLLLLALLAQRRRSYRHHRPIQRTLILLGLLLGTFSLQACDCLSQETQSQSYSQPKRGVKKLPASRNLPLHRLKLPPGFKISLYASHVPYARSLARGPKGTIFVGTRSSGTVYALVDRDKDGKADEIYTLLTDLFVPNGVAMRGKDLYVGEINRILRLEDIEDHLNNPPKPKVIFDSYPKNTHHGWKFIRFGPDGYLYVPVGAPCNICKSKSPIFASITRIKPDGSGFEIFAHGVRNTVGFDWHPITKELWFTDNGRDWLGDERPPCELNHAPKKGLHFGYPYCHGADIADPKFGKLRKCSEFRPPAHEMRAHTAPLGMRFYTGKMFPSKYHQQIFVAQHGSWNRSKPIGYRVMNAFLDKNKVVSFKPFIEGFLHRGRAWGRPVDLLNMPDGSLLLSDDAAGAVYRITYTKP
ncbi:MAG: DUF2330 domain-containing protein [Myxococcales bacterium]|nr:DUF2330 domain-containing protein [Myxococcales bacterium]